MFSSQKVRHNNDFCLNKYKVRHNNDFCLNKYNEGFQILSANGILYGNAVEGNLGLITKYPQYADGLAKALVQLRQCYLVSGERGNLYRKLLDANAQYADSIAQAIYHACQSYLLCDVETGFSDRKSAQLTIDLIFKHAPYAEGIAKVISELRLSESLDPNTEDEYYQNSYNEKDCSSLSKLLRNLRVQRHENLDLICQNSQSAKDISEVVAQLRSLGLMSDLVRQENFKLLVKNAKSAVSISSALNQLCEAGLLTASEWQDNYRLLCEHIYSISELDVNQQVDNEEKSFLSCKV